MASSPALLFYTKDWITGTTEMEPAEKGIYIDLICHQHINGSLPVDEKKLARICGLELSEFLKLWKTVKHKYKQLDNRLVNQKVEQVVKQTTYRALKNKVNGSLPRLLEKYGLKKSEKREVYKKIRESINYDLFLEKSDEEIKHSLNQLVDHLVNYIANANANEDINENSLEEKKGKKNNIINVHFDEFWNLYDKKINRKDSERKWNKLTDQERTKIIETLPTWLKQFSEKQYQPFPITYLNQCRWEDVPPREKFNYEVPPEYYKTKF